MQRNQNKMLAKIKFLFSKDTFSRENIDNFLNKVRSIKKEDVLLWYYSHRNVFLFNLFLIAFFVLCGMLVVIIKNTYVTYKKLQANVSAVSLVTDKKIIDFIKTKRLRTVTSVCDSLYVKEYNRFNNKHYTDLCKKVLKEIIVNVYYSDSVAASVLDSKLWVTNILSKKEKIQKIFNLINSYSLKQLKDFDKDLAVRKYLSEFPSLNKSVVLEYIKDKKLVNDTAEVLSKLYIYELPAISKFLLNQANIYEKRYLSNIAPYENFLSYILFPSVNIWIDSFSQAVNPDIFGGEYLKRASYIDLNLIKYWSDFFTTSYKGKLYQWLNNIIESLKLKKIDVLTKENLAKIWLNIKFSLLDDKSFYGLISKLTITSNVKNIMLLNEFTYDLWNEVKKYMQTKLPSKFAPKEKLGTRWIAYQLYKCTQNFDNDCKKLFNCKWDCKLPSQIDAETLKNNVNITDVNSLLSSYFGSNFRAHYTNSSFYKFIKNEYYKINDWNKLVGARLYDCIKQDWYCGDIFDKNYSQIANTIKVFAKCDKSKPIDFVCKYKFINKFNTNYFIAYTMVDKLWKINYSLLERLKDVYNNLPSVLQMDKFTFVKNEGKNTLALYTADVGLSVFYKYLTQDEYNKVLSFIGQGSCKSVTNWSSFDLWKALSYVKNKYNILSKWDVDAAKLYDLKELQKIIDNLQKESNKAKLLDKLLANLQVYRIFKERGYCK